MRALSFFNRWFYIAVILVLAGLALAPYDPQHAASNFALSLAKDLLKTTGVALLVANVFTFTMGTEQFMEYVRRRLIDIVVSKQFVDRLSEEDQRHLLKMTLSPPRNYSEVYSGIEDYFQNHIDESMQLFDSCYRGHFVINAEATIDSSNNRLKIIVDLDYIMYRIAESFDPLMLWFEDDDSRHVKTTIKSADGDSEEITDQSLEQTHDIDDPCMVKGFRMPIPERFNKHRHINISRRVEEFGQDHWQVFSYKAIKACDQLLINLRCSDDIVVRRCETYGAQEDFDIQISEDRTHVRVSYSDWLKPGFGVNILLARDDWH